MKKTTLTPRNGGKTPAKRVSQERLDLAALKEENSEPNRGRSLLIVEAVNFSKTKTAPDFVELLTAQVIAADGCEQSPEFGELRDGLSKIKEGLAELYRIQAKHKMRAEMLPLGQ